MIDLDTKWRESRSRIDFLNKDKNRFQKEVTKAKKAGGEDPENAAKIKEVAKEVKVVEAKMGECCCTACGRVGAFSIFGLALGFVAFARLQDVFCVVVSGDGGGSALIVIVGHGAHQTNGLVSALLPFGSLSADVA